MPFAAFAIDRDFERTALTVAVAANVQFAFDEIKTIFEENTGIPVNGIIASSGTLTTQIKNGAPFDIFLSADTEYSETLFTQGLTHDAPEIYAYGTLVLWTLSDINLSDGIQILTKPSVKKIAMPTPQTAPYGRQAMNTLKHYRLYESVNSKLVYGKSIAQTNQFIASRAVDIGFTSKSVVLAPHMKDQGKWIEVDKDTYEPIAQTAVILKFTEDENLPSAQKFYDFLFSQKARDIFQKYGYILPDEEDER
jgi:molybdate transport system substrate-binding protein